MRKWRELGGEPFGGRLGVGAGLGLGGGGGGFTGPYDAITDITAAYGMRRLLSSYTSNLIRIRRSSDNSEQDFGYDANGDLDTAAIATFVGAGSGYVVTWYDQSGNGNDATQATAASQPLYVASAQNSLPVLRFDGTDDNFLLPLSESAGSWTFSASLSFADTSVQRRLFDAQTGRLILSHLGDTTRTTNYYDGAWRVSATPATGAQVLTWHLTSGGNGVIYRNSVSLGSATYSEQALGGTVRLGSDYAGLNGFEDDIFEFLVCNAALSTAQRQGVESAANSYWNIY